jgi:hypothetical protein
VHYNIVPDEPDNISWLPIFFDISDYLYNPSLINFIPVKGFHESKVNIVSAVKPIIYISGSTVIFQYGEDDDHEMKVR